MKNTATERVHPTFIFKNEEHKDGIHLGAELVKEKDGWHCEDVCSHDNGKIEMGEMNAIKSAINAYPDLLSTIQKIDSHKGIPKITELGGDRFEIVAENGNEKFKTTVGKDIDESMNEVEINKFLKNPERYNLAPFYIVEFNGMDDVEVMSQRRMIEYAENRFDANEHERSDWSFDTHNMNAEQALEVISSFGEYPEKVMMDRGLNSLLQSIICGDDPIEEIAERCFFDDEIRDYIAYLEAIDDKFEDLDTSIRDIPPSDFIDSYIAEAKKLHVENNIINGNRKDAGAFMAKYNMSIDSIDVSDKDRAIVEGIKNEMELQAVKDKNKASREKSKSLEQSISQPKQKA